MIQRGYYRRHRHSWEQARLIAYHVRYCMGLGTNETVKPITEFVQFPWEKRDIPDAPMVTEEDIRELQELMEQVNLAQ